MTARERAEKRQGWLKEIDSHLKEWGQAESHRELWVLPGVWDWMFDQGMTAVTAAENGMLWEVKAEAAKALVSHE